MTISKNLPSVIAPRSLTIADLNVTINHEPRIMDIKLAEMLGMLRPRKIRELIRKYMTDLERFGDVAIDRPQRGQTAETLSGRPSLVYYLSKKQALYICTKSNTSLATEVTIRMVEVFDEYMMGKLGMSKNSMTEHYLQSAFIHALNIGEELKVAKEFLAEIPFTPTQFSLEQHLQAISSMQENLAHSITYLTAKILPNGTPKTRIMRQHLLA